MDKKLWVMKKADAITNLTAEKSKMLREYNYVGAAMCDAQIKQIIQTNKLQ